MGSLTPSVILLVLGFILTDRVPTHAQLELCSATIRGGEGGCWRLGGQRLGEEEVGWCTK